MLTHILAMPINKLMRLFVVFLIVFFSNSAFADILKKEILEINIMLMNKDRLCIALLKKNISDKGVFVERSTIVYKGETPLTPFKIVSNGGKEYKYTGPLDLVPSISYNGYTFIPKGQQDVSFFCLTDYFSLDKEVTKVWYESPEVYYEVVDGRMKMVGDEYLKSNTLNISGQDLVIEKKTKCKSKK